MNKKKIIAVGAAGFVLFLLISYWSYIGRIIISVLQAMSPIFYGCAFAYVVNILTRFYETKLLQKSKKIKRPGIKRAIAMLLAYMSIIIIAALVMYLVISEFYACLETLLQQVPKSISQIDLDAMIREWFPELNIDFGIHEKLEAAVQGFTAHIAEYMTSIATGVSSVVGVFVNFFISLVFSVYFLAGKEKICAQIRHLGRLLIKENTRKKMNYILHTLDHSFHNFIVGQFIEACILGTLCFIGMMVLRLPYAGMIGTLIGFTALIPILGAYIGAGVGAIMIVTVSPFKALIFVIFIVVLQQLEGNLIYPKVVGSSIGLPGVWVFATITVAGGVLGIPGMLLGVPTAAAVYKMLQDYSAMQNESIQSKEASPK